mgnify:FL=1|tara:strand:+ start:14845 stop:16479 length:1635 start_codon:yes stop_codon:yes gene_type:complete
MSDFKEISNIVEEKLKQFHYDIPINIKFSNFSKRFDVQINELVQIVKDSKFSEVTQEIKDSFEESNLIEKFEILETGFINIKLSNEFLAIALGKKLNDFRDEKAKEETVIFDYGGANIGKSLHVGHIRTLNIGRALKNIYEIAGYKTISDIHFGDWGMPIALILAYIEDKNIDINEVSHKSLENIYPEASNLSKTDKNFYTKALEISKQLNEQDKNRISQWKKIYNISTENIKTLLNKLDFKFDYYLGESDVVELIPDYIEELKEANLVKLDQGALIANDGQTPPALITKSDGSYMYLTTDIGTILFREQEFNCDKYIYVVDQRQKNHFNQLFKLVRYFQLSNSEFLHVGFGTVNDSQGKPLKTRDGKNYKLLDLYKDIEDKLTSVNSDKKIVETLAKSVLTYSDLVTKRTSNYIFDLEKFTNVTGKSAIFIQYSQVRAKRLLEQSSKKLKLDKIQENERPLIIELIKFPYIFNMSLKSNEPHHIAEYAYTLCQEFNRFYSKDKIISDDVNEITKIHKLFIVNAFYETITLIFYCLGIEPADNM